MLADVGGVVNVLTFLFEEFTDQEHTHEQGIHSHY
jgi:hypothetical protein